MLQRLFEEIDFWDDLFGTWRMVLIICLGQIIGGYIGHILGDYWPGGAIAGLPATLLGAGWHYSARQRRNVRHLTFVKLCVVLAVVMFAAGVAKAIIG